MSKTKVYNVDCMEYMATLPDKAFDLAIVDPPYGININASGRLGHYGGARLGMITHLMTTILTSCLEFPKIK